jgi:hypothetical protein
MKKSVAKYTTILSTKPKIFLALCLASFLGQSLEAAPQTLGKISNGSSEVTVQCDQDFKFNSEGNIELMRKVFKGIPFVRSVDVVAAGKYEKHWEYTSPTDKSYHYKDLKRTILLSVDFERSQAIPTMVFDIQETYKDCLQDNTANCVENAKFEMTGPSEVHSLQNDFTNFPKAKQLRSAFAASVRFNNEAPTGTAALMEWNIETEGLGLMSLVNYLSSKSLISKQPTSEGVFLAFNIWAASVSQAVLQN